MLTLAFTQASDIILNLAQGYGGPSLSVNGHRRNGRKFWRVGSKSHFRPTIMRIGLLTSARRPRDCSRDEYEQRSFLDMAKSIPLIRAAVLGPMIRWLRTSGSPGPRAPAIGRSWIHLRRRARASSTAVLRIRVLSEIGRPGGTRYRRPCHHRKQCCRSRQIRSRNTRLANSARRPAARRCGASSLLNTRTYFAPADTRRALRTGRMVNGSRRRDDAPYPAIYGVFDTAALFGDRARSYDASEYSHPSAPRVWDRTSSAILRSSSRNFK